ncbi:MAG TPA: hypothetical protein VFQ15_06160 [Jiangellaceae bacterium]|nr:hypothetical protein [Jiangellaceae bacterium]
MNRAQLAHLQQVRSYPAVSILLPTHRHAPQNQQDKIVLRNLVADAQRRLAAEHADRDIAPLLSELAVAVDEIDFEHLLDGLAVFATAEEHHVVPLPTSVPERVVVDDNFATRDLVRALNRTPEYWVLVIDDQVTRLYAGTGGVVEEFTDGEFPVRRPPLPDPESTQGRFGVDPSQVAHEAQRRYLREVEQTLRPLLAAGSRRLVVVGVQRMLAFWSEVGGNGGAVIGTVTGSHERTSAHELAKLVEPVVAEQLANERAAAVAALDTAMGARRYAAGIEEVWELAAQGRGAHLVVEDGLTVPAVVRSGRLEPLTEEATDTDVLDDVVDEAVEAVFAGGGRVTFVEDGGLADRDRIAMVLRY